MYCILLQSHMIICDSTEIHKKMKSRLTQKEAFEKQAGRQQKQNYFWILNISRKKKKTTTFSSCNTASKKHRDTFKPTHILVLDFNNRS